MRQSAGRHRVLEVSSGKIVLQQPGPGREHGQAAHQQRAMHQRITPTRGIMAGALESRQRQTRHHSALAPIGVWHGPQAGAFIQAAIQTAGQCLLLS